MSGVFLDCCPPYWLREGLSQLNSELISRANLSSQNTLCLSGTGITGRMPSPSAVMWMLGISTLNLHLCGDNGLLVS